MKIIDWKQGLPSKPISCLPPLEVWIVDFSYDSGARTEVWDLHSFFTGFSVWLDPEGNSGADGHDRTEKEITAWAHKHFPSWTIEKLRPEDREVQRKRLRIYLITHMTDIDIANLCRRLNLQIHFGDVTSVRPIPDIYQALVDLEHCPSELVEVIQL